MRGARALDLACAWPARRLGFALMLACAVPPALAQGKVDMKLMQRYGGVLAPDCSNYMLPQLKYLGDTLVVQDGGRVLLTGRNVRPAPAHFGDRPPPEFETALASEVGPGEPMVFVFYRNASGLYAVVEGGPRVKAALPPALKGKRARHCDPNRNVAPGTVLTAPPQPPDLLKDTAFRVPYVRALGPLAREPWLLRLDGPAPPLKDVTVAGQKYRMASACKSHDCEQNTVVVLYAPATRTVYGKVVQQGRSTLLGAPPPAVAAELERLWKAEWRGGK